MNIQISVTIWTVICFLILMTVLKNLLFTPVLRVIDARRERIEAAKEKREKIEQLTAENEIRLEKERNAAREKSVREAKEKVQQIQLQGKKDIEAAQRQCLDDVEKYRENIGEEYEKIVFTVAPKMETAAAIFAKNIISHRI